MTNKTKKLSFLSVILFVIGGTIGAGIFFKNESLNKMAQGQFGIVMATWGVAIVGMLALAIALWEITSAQKTNKGILEWTKLFTPKWFHKSANNFTKWVLLPVSLFTMPIYVTNTLEDAGMTLHHNLEALAISFGIFFWFFVINMISIKVGNLANWITTILQVAPLIVLPIIGMIHTGQFDSDVATVLNKHTEAKDGLMGQSPWLALLGGMGAIAFAFDGFYQAAAIKNDMEKPEKNGKALLLGVLVISVFYIFVTLGFQLSGNGNVYGLFSFMPTWTFKLMNALIAVGIMGIVNAWAMSSPNQLRDMAQDEENKDVAWFERKFQKLFKLSDSQARKYASFGLLFMFTTFLFLTIGVVGSLVYKDGYSWDTDIYTQTGKDIPTDEYTRIYGGGALYSFADTITNYMSLMVFVVLAIVVIFGIINRKTGKVKVKTNRLFVPCGIVFVTVFLSAFVYYMVEAITNMTGFNGADHASSIINFSILLGMLALSIVPALISEYGLKNKKAIASK